MGEKFAYVPYKGSKNRLASWVLENITSTIKPSDDRILYDLFGGGGAVASYASSYHRDSFQAVHYNELDPAIYELIKLINSEDGVRKISDWRSQWITREDFKLHKDQPTAWGGYIKTIWSFGNSCEEYMYGIHLQDFKEALHRFLFFPSNKTLQMLPMALSSKVTLGEIVAESDIQERWKVIQKSLRAVTNSYSEDEHTEYKLKNKGFRKWQREKKHSEALTFTGWLKKQGIKAREINEVLDTDMGGHYLSSASQPSIPTVRMWEGLSQVFNLSAPPDMQRLIYDNRDERDYWKEYLGDNGGASNALKELYYMESLPSYSRNSSLLVKGSIDELTNLSYSEVSLEGSPVVYLDPPYRGTSGYVAGSINYEALEKYVSELTLKGVPVFMSEYSCDFKGMVLLAEVGKVSTFSPTSKLKTVEKLYWNGVR